MPSHSLDRISHLTLEESKVDGVTLKILYEDRFLKECLSIMDPT
jgi:hypothetical protein